jgi:CheY-like chemotaxis protein
VTEQVEQQRQLERHAAELEHRVTERTQELRYAMEEAEQANRTKSEFLAGISHELRTPMNAILGFAQLLELDELEDEQADNVRQILRAGRHLLELITELLDIARIESGELALSLEAVSLEGLLAEAADLTRPLAEQHGVTVELDGDVGGYVLADRQRALQVLLNLLANGVKYNRPGGSVTVGCSEDGAGRVAIAVRDTGHGIAAEDLERLFVPFERLGLEGGTIEGAGLGLTLAQRLVEAMEGTIAVTSDVGEGSTFTVELPRADDPLAALEETGPGLPAAAGRTATVLYIEDNLANLQLVKRALARQPGLTVLEATHGEAGLEIARTSRPDLVLLDLHLPDVSGEEVLEALAADPETCDIPVVIVSAAASKGRVQRLRQRGAREYLTKPIDIAELLAVVNATLGGRR